MIVNFRYTNHRHAVAERHLDVHSLDFLPNPGFEYPAGWFLTGFDIDKAARRSFYLPNIIIQPTGISLRLREK